jgi:site-specific DNA-methyltransferase (adenine-specific)
MDKKSVILKRARELAKKAKTWADFSNALFDPFDGELVRALPTQEDRETFRRTREYKEIRALLQRKMNETGLVKGATPTKSGKFVVRLPRSLHAALEKEAEIEATSLNQLVVTKLAVQLDNLAGGRLASLIQAFGEVREGYSADRVIADPQLNRKFLRRCRELGLSGTDYDLNWSLMNERKKGNLSHLPKTKRYTVRELDKFEYASELAVRFLQNEKSVSLDRIICDPELAEEFDEYAAKLSPGFSALQYRWAAFGLRKAGRLQNVPDKRPEWEHIGRVSSLRLKKIPEIGGLYLFTSDQQRIFIGQTDNLHHRVEKHMEVSSSKGLPIWLWNTKRHPLEIEVASMPNITRSLRQAMELLLVKEWKPLLNFQRKVA